MTYWIIIVDDDIANLKIAGHILSKNQMRVTALRSGQALLDYLAQNSLPDLILLDINMPVMDGFQTLKRIRQLEKERGSDETPVVFLTADEDADTETQGFEIGISDYIRKPFHPDVLLRRINNIVMKQQKMKNLKTQAYTDKLTGFLNKTASGIELSKFCAGQAGCLMMIDLDSFKLVNDIYGHEMGDRVLISFASIIRENVPPGSCCGRIGGDEFAVFCLGMLAENDIAKLTQRLNSELLASAKAMMGSEMDIPLGASVGAVFVPKQGNDYDMLLKYADKALYTVKQNGKHGYSLFRADQFSDEELNVKGTDITTISEILGERTIPNVALQLDKESFSYVYRYIMRYIVRNQRSACKVLLTLSCNEGVTDAVYKDDCDDFGIHIRESLRKSDILMRSRYNQYFVFLTDIRKDSIEKVINNLIHSWHVKRGKNIAITYEAEFVGYEGEYSKAERGGKVVIVDDDAANRLLAAHILTEAGFYVTTLDSGPALLQYVEEEKADLILLDVKMPGMDGFETLRRLHDAESNASVIPVVFLTADDSQGAESRGLSLGAMDFIKKPFIPEVLLLRVRHIIELVSLQRSLNYEVEKKTAENQSLFVHVVHSLADAIDAKDTYTKGHSGRVAKYAREIAKRAGFPAPELNDIYIMGLLHDVGKIGVPDAVINKPAQLSDEEYDAIKIHPIMGARILRNIKEMPKLANGARWHHERYDGSGYPDKLKGKDIPKEARIIAIADAYDAMTSRRSYREPLSQLEARMEILNGKGTQFDPLFADIMLAMIDEDEDFTMREH